MTGLILKDFLILRKSLRTYLLFIAFYVGLAFAGVWSPEFVGGFMMVLTAMLPMNVFAYDKQAKWDTYGLALPVGRTKTVCARYICVLLLCLASIILMTVLGIVMTALGRIEDPASYLFTCVGTGLIAIFMNAAILPLLYKFGPEQARIMLYVLLGIIALISLGLLFPLGGIELLKGWEPTPFQIAAAPFIAALAGLVFLTLSFLLSRAFYGAKDV